MPFVARIVNLFMRYLSQHFGLDSFIHVSNQYLKKKKKKLYCSFSTSGTFIMLNYTSVLSDFILRYLQLAWNLK